ncbi:MAG TPA: sigma-70 family RNA polymerase sigma factor [Acidothermaceae bacterium]
MDAARNKLITEHLDIAHAIAHQIANEFYLQHVFDDLLGYANQGLVEAAGRYSPSADTRFRTFCWTRVRGAVIDGIRKQFFGRRKMSDGGRPSHVSYLAKGTSGQPRATPVPLHDPEAALDYRRVRTALVQALAALPEAQREIVIRKHCRNELIHEIAADLGIHRSNAARQHMAGLRALRSALGELGAGEEACQ